MTLFGPGPAKMNWPATGPREQGQGDKCGGIGEHVKKMPVLRGEELLTGGRAGEEGLETVDGTEGQDAEGETHNIPAAKNNEGKHEESTSRGHVAYEVMIAHRGKIGTGNA